LTNRPHSNIVSVQLTECRADSFFSGLRHGFRQGLADKDSLNRSIQAGVSIGVGAMFFALILMQFL